METFILELSSNDRNQAKRCKKPTALLASVYFSQHFKCSSISIDRNSFTGSISWWERNHTINSMGFSPDPSFLRLPKSDRIVTPFQAYLSLSLTFRLEGKVVKRNKWQRPCTSSDPFTPHVQYSTHPLSVRLFLFTVTSLTSKGNYKIGTHFHELHSVMLANIMI